MRPTANVPVTVQGSPSGLVASSGGLSPTSPYRIEMMTTPSALRSRESPRVGERVRTSSRMCTDGFQSGVRSSARIGTDGAQATGVAQLAVRSLEAPSSKLSALDSLSTQGTSVPNSPKGERPSTQSTPSGESMTADDGAVSVPSMSSVEKKMKYYRYDSLVKLDKPFSRPVRRLLEITELPFMIMWVYFTYWVIIVSLCATQVRNTVWLSAGIAGLLVGIGLNANAYRMIIEHGVIDYGVIIRFFLIPFGVSSLSGMTNSLRDQFLLVFPRDPFELTISICIPAMVVSCLVMLRLFILWRLQVRMTLRVLLLNGSLTDRCRCKGGATAFEQGYISCN